MLDLLIKNGKIMDGTANPWFYGSVAVKDGKIVKVGLVDGDSAKQEIDAKGLVVAPGFVDIHTHADFILPLKNHVQILEPFVRQGITTLVVGNCGYSPAPINPKTLDLMKKYTGFVQGGELTWEWHDMKGYLDFIEKQGVAFNVVPLTSHGAIRIYVKGFDSGPATRAEREEMAKLARQAMEQGAFGLSAGLIYPPGSYSDTDELIAICKPLKDFGGVFTCHLRGESEVLLSATKEIIKVGEANGIAVEHSHLETYGKEYWAQRDRLIALHDEARARGIDITYDIIPYTAANTTIMAILPPWSLEGGVDKLIERLQDRETRKRIEQDVAEAQPGWPPWLPGGWPNSFAKSSGWDNIVVIWVGSKANKHLEGKILSEIAKGAGKTPFDAAADLIVQERGQIMALYFGFDGDMETDEGKRKLIANPRAAINTDAILTGRGVSHPAAYGAFPRVLGYFSRELGLFTMEEAVRKMTSMSMQRFGIMDRGLIRPGFFADLTIFNPETVNETGTYFDPAHFPEGIKYVIINGAPVVENGVYNGELCGHVLRKRR